MGNTRSIRSEDFFLEITMILEEKYRNTRSIQSEDLFFRDHDDFGKKKRNTRLMTFFYLENTNFWESLPRAPNFEYPSLHTHIHLTSYLLILISIRNIKLGHFRHNSIQLWFKVTVYVFQRELRGPYFEHPCSKLM